MNIEITNRFIVPFNVNQSSVWKQVVKDLCLYSSVPADAICDSKCIKVERKYFEVKDINIKYSIDWSATSIFTQRWTELKSHVERQIRYFDRLGQQHESPGFDYFDKSSGRWKNGALHPLKSSILGLAGNAGTRPWEPREVDVTVTESIEHEKETCREQNSDIFEETCNRSCSSDDFHFNVNISYIDSEDLIPYDNQLFNETGEVVWLPDSIFNQKFQQILKDTRVEAVEKIIKKIPGQRYANLKTTFDSKNRCRILYYPVYVVLYSYKDRDYICHIPGYYNEKRVQIDNPFKDVPNVFYSYLYHERMPKDDSIKKMKDKSVGAWWNLEGVRNKLKWNYIKILLGCPVVLLIFSRFLKILKDKFFIWEYSNQSLVKSTLPFLLILIGTELILFNRNRKKIAVLDNTISSIKTQNENLDSWFKDLKFKIFDIVFSNKIQKDKDSECRRLLQKIHF